MKKILSLLSAFALIICLSSFTKDADLVKCETQQTITITSTSDCPVKVDFGSGSIKIFLPNIPQVIEIGAAGFEVCVESNPDCDVSVTIVHSMIEICENSPFPNSTGLICASTEEIAVPQGAEMPSCVTFSCLTQFGG